MLDTNRKAHKIIACDSSTQKQCNIYVFKRQFARANFRKD